MSLGAVVANVRFLYNTNEPPRVRLHTPVSGSRHLGIDLQTNLPQHPHTPLFALSQNRMYAFTADKVPSACQMTTCVCTRTGKELDIAAKLPNQVHIDTVWVVQYCQLAAWSSRQILRAWIWHVRWFRFNQLSTIVGTSIFQSLRKPRITHFQFITSSRLPSLQSIVLNITLQNKNHAVATQPNLTPNPP
jgi:hypothetical protein